MGTVTDDVPESFSGLGSGVCEDAVATLVNVVPCGVAGGMWAMKVKFALDPAGKSARVQVIVPFVPGEGWLLQSNAGPLFCVAETKVIPGGNGSVSDAESASSKPKLKIVTSNETSVSAAAVDGLFFETARSASCANAAGTSPAKAMKMAREGRIVRSFTVQDYSNLSRAAYSRPCDSATAL